MREEEELAQLSYRARPLSQKREVEYWLLTNHEVEMFGLNHQAISKTLKEWNWDKGSKQTPEDMPPKERERKVRELIKKRYTNRLQRKWEDP